MVARAGAMAIPNFAHYHQFRGKHHRNLGAPRNRGIELQTEPGLGNVQHQGAQMGTRLDLDIRRVVDGVPHFSSSFRPTDLIWLRGLAGWRWGSGLTWAV